jgi:hypothetical protein
MLTSLELHLNASLISGFIMLELKKENNEKSKEKNVINNNILILLVSG